MSAAIARTKASSIGSSTRSDSELANSIPELTRVTIEVAPGFADLAATALLEQLSAGSRVNPESEGRVTLDVWFPTGDSPGAADVREALEAWRVPATVTSEREGPDWYTAAREFHRPIEIARALRVRPPWEPASTDLIDVVIDPGMAFGSGQHATTRGCLEALCELPRGGLVDVGCGSGILAIAAAKLGYEPVRAIDNDPHSVAATRENAAANAVSLDVSQGNAEESVQGAEVMVANLTAATLLELAGAPPDPLPRNAVVSGIRDFELDAVHSAWARHGLIPTQVDERDGWCTSVLAR
jgi:ribosomal protein L11 methyltransferase